MTQTMKEIIAVVIAIPLVITLCVLGVGGAGILLQDWKQANDRRIEQEYRDRVEQRWGGKECRDVFTKDERYRFCD